MDQVKSMDTSGWIHCKNNSLHVKSSLDIFFERGQDSKSENLVAEIQRYNLGTNPLYFYEMKTTLKRAPVIIPHWTQNLRLFPELLVLRWDLPAMPLLLLLATEIPSDSWGAAEMCEMTSGRKSSIEPLDNPNQFH